MIRNITRPKAIPKNIFIILYVIWRERRDYGLHLKNFKILPESSKIGNIYLVRGHLGDRNKVYKVYVYYWREYFFPSTSNLGMSSFPALTLL